MDLLNEAEIIVVGTVTGVTDGVDSMGLGREGVAAFGSAVGGLAAVEWLLLWGARRIGGVSPVAVPA